MLVFNKEIEKKILKVGNVVKMVVIDNQDDLDKLARLMENKLEKLLDYFKVSSLEEVRLIVTEGLDLEYVVFARFGEINKVSELSDKAVVEAMKNQAYIDNIGLFDKLTIADDDELNEVNSVLQLDYIYNCMFEKLNTLKNEYLGNVEKEEDEVGDTNIFTEKAESAEENVSENSQDNINESTEELSKVKGQLEERIKLFNQLQAELEAERKHSSDILEKLEQSKQNIATIEELKKKLEASDARIKELEEELKSTENEREQLEKDLSEKKESSEELENLKKELLEAKERVERLTQELADEKKANEELKNSAVSEEEFNEIKEQNDNLVKEHETVTKNLERAIDGLRSSKEKIQSLEDEIKELTESKKSIESELSKVKDSMESVSQMLSANDVKMKGELELKENELNNLKQALESEKAASKKLEESLNNIKEKQKGNLKSDSNQSRSGLLEKLNIYETTILELKAKIEEYTRRMEKADLRIKHFENIGKSSNVVSEVDKLLLDKDSLEGKLESLTKSYAELEEERNKLKDELFTTSMSEKDLNKNVSEMRITIGDLNEKLRETEGDYESLQEKYKKALEDIESNKIQDTSVEELSRKLEEARQKVEESEKQRRQIEVELEKYQTSRENAEDDETLENEVVRLKEELKLREEVCEEYETRIASLTEKIELLEDVNHEAVDEDHTKELEEYMELVESLEKANRQLEEDKAVLNQRLEDLNSEEVVDVSSDNYDDILQELNEAKGTIEDLEKEIERLYSQNEQSESKYQLTPMSEIDSLFPVISDKDFLEFEHILYMKEMGASTFTEDIIACLKSLFSGLIDAEDKRVLILVADPLSEVYRSRNYRKMQYAVNSAIDINKADDVYVLVTNAVSLEKIKEYAELIKFEILVVVDRFGREKDYLKRKEAVLCPIISDAYNADMNLDDAVVPFRSDRARYSADVSNSYYQMNSAQRISELMSKQILAGTVKECLK